MLHHRACNAGAESRTEFSETDILASRVSSRYVPIFRRFWPPTTMSLEQPIRYTVVRCRCNPSALKLCKPSCSTGNPRALSFSLKHSHILVYVSLPVSFNLSPCLVFTMGLKMAWLSEGAMPAHNKYFSKAVTGQSWETVLTITTSLPPQSWSVLLHGTELVIWLSEMWIPGLLFVLAHQNAENKLLPNKDQLGSWISQYLWQLQPKFQL